MQLEGLESPAACVALENDGGVLAAAALPHADSQLDVALAEDRMPAQVSETGGRRLHLLQEDDVRLPTQSPVTNASWPSTTRHLRWSRSIHPSD